MKVTIIYFSPCGNTRKVATKIGYKFAGKGWEVQLLEMTRDAELFPSRDFRTFIKKIEGHDLLIVGGPVYIDHLHYNVLDLIRGLPEPDGKFYSKKAGAFTTFGRITPGAGGIEALDTLMESGRTVSALLEVDSEHCISRNIGLAISQGRPGGEIDKLVEEYVAVLTGAAEVNDENCTDLRSGLVEEIEELTGLADEREVVASSFPEVSFDYELCGGCLSCVKVCPVNYLYVKNGLPAKIEEDICIHCTSCLHACPNGAVLMDLWDKAPFYEKRLKDQNLETNGPSRSRLVI